MTEDEQNHVPMKEAEAGLLQLFRRNRWLVIFGACLLITVTGLIVILTGTPPKSTKLTTASQGTQPTLSTLKLDERAAIAMVGYGLLPTEAGGSIQPERSVTRAELAVLLSTVLKLSGNVPSRPSYIDVLPNHPHYVAIEAVKSLFGYQKSSSQASQRFEPDLAMKRSEAVRVLSLALNLDPATSALFDLLKLPADDPVRVAAEQPLLRQYAARIFYCLIEIRLPSPAPSFGIQGVH